MIYLFCVVIVVSSAFVGRAITQKYVQRDEFFKELINFLHRLKNDISFRKIKLNELIDGYISKSKNKYSCIIAELFKNCNMDGRNLRFLKNDEKMIINNFVSSLGSSSAEIEVSNIDNFIENIKSISLACEVERKKNGILYYKLSIAVGIVVCVLII